MCEYEYKHWCGNCQIRIYVQRHYGRLLTWHDCPYHCEYATAMRCSEEAKGESDEHVGLDMIAMKVVDDVIGMNTFPSPCTNCRNNPINGGSGICHCILGGTDNMLKGEQQ